MCVYLPGGPFPSLLPARWTGRGSGSWNRHRGPQEGQCLLKMVGHQEGRCGSLMIVDHHSCLLSLLCENGKISCYLVQSTFNLVSLLQVSDPLVYPN